MNHSFFRLPRDERGHGGEAGSGEGKGRGVPAGPGRLKGAAVSRCFPSLSSKIREKQTKMNVQSVSGDGKWISWRMNELEDRLGAGMG